MYGILTMTHVTSCDTYDMHHEIDIPWLQESLTSIFSSKKVTHRHRNQFLIVSLCQFHDASSCLETVHKPFSASKKDTKNQACSSWSQTKIGVNRPIPIYKSVTTSQSPENSLRCWKNHGFTPFPNSLHSWSVFQKSALVYWWNVNECDMSN